MAFTLTKEQEQAVFRRGGLLVSAAAGSGKTRVLVERLLAQVEAGVDIDRFLVITYTRAAAAELRGRVVSELSERLIQRPEDAFLRRQATLIYKAQISTIHAFCAQFLREEGHRLELDADFRLCDDSEGRMLMEEALNSVLDKRYESIETDGDFALLVDAMSAGRDDSRLMGIVLDIRERIQSHPDPEVWLREQERAFALEGVEDAGATPWGELLLKDVRRQADYWVARMAQAGTLCRGDAVLEKAYLPSVEATREALEALSRATEVGWDETAARAEVEFPRLGSSRNCEDPYALERVKLLREECKKRMKRVARLFGDDSRGYLEDMRAVYPAIRGLFALVRDFEAAYGAQKARRGVLDFSDLEHMTARLLLDGEGSPTELARRWGERFDEVMVDEYQDANAVQNAIFTALSDGGRRLFMVGDVKQSIYRFRLADPTIFLSKYRAYKPLEEDGETWEGEEPRRVLLSRNFRSRPQVLEGCNYLFRAVMSEAFGEMDYTDDEALIPGAAFPEGEGTDYALELDVLDCSAAGEEEDSGPKPSRDQLEARFVARRARAMLDEGFQVSDGEGGLRRVKPGDMVILLRSPGTVLHHYAAALAGEDIPWEAEGGGDFFAATEIQVALSLLRIVDNPRQDVALIAALRSAVYAFSADRLSQIRAAAPDEDFYTALTRDGGEDTRRFLEELQALREQAGDESCDRLLWQIYDRTNLLGVYGAMDEGEQRRGNLLLLAQLSREFEAAGHRGLFSFLDHLRRLEESGGGPSLAGGRVGEGVRLLSIHRSKGLEFPVVFLAGLARQLNRQDQTLPILFHLKLGVGPKRLDLERMVEYPTLARLAVGRQMDYELSAEELRLLYVAMTRAREKLVMTCALTGGRRDVDKLLPSAGAPVEPQALLDCVSPAQWVLLAALARPEAALLREGSFPPPVEPGVDFGPGWDIRWVDAAPCAQADGARRAEKTGEAKVAEAPQGLTEALGWVYPHAEDAALPSKLTATQLKGRALDEEAAEQAPRPSRASSPRRPGFAEERLGLTPAQRGTALHLAMQYIDFSRCGGVSEIAGELERLVSERFLTRQQIQAVSPEKIHAFFASPLGREMLASPGLRREFKFSILVPARRYFPQAGEEERVLLQGVVDCCFETPEGLVVVDFKTDHVYGDALEARAEGYRPQLEAYAQALGEITGKPVCRRVLWFFSEGREIQV